MLGVGAYLVILHELTPGGMIAAAIILARGLAPVEQLINSWRFFTDARTSYRRLGELVARTPDEGERTALPRPGGRVSAEQVSYVPPGCASRCSSGRASASTAARRWASSGHRAPARPPWCASSSAR